MGRRLKRDPEHRIIGVQEGDGVESGQGDLRSFVDDLVPYEFPSSSSSDSRWSVVIQTLTSTEVLTMACSVGNSPITT